MSRKSRNKIARYAPPQAAKSPLLTALEGKLAQAEKRLVEAYTQADDMLAGWERERDEILNGGGLGGRRGSRKDGGEWPYLRTMEDLIQMRRASREACEGNGYGAGMIDRAIDFVIGDGMQHEVTLIGPKAGAVSTGVADADGDGRPDADPRVEAVEQVIEEFRRLNDWGCGEEDREEEGFRRSQRDGEVFVRFFAGGGDTNGVPLVRWVEPEQVDSPPSAEPNERWGRRYKPGDVESVTDTYVYDVDGIGGEWVPNREIVFHKLGTDRTVLRGMPQFWLVARALYQSDALNSALAEVSAIQAKIAYVREHAPGIMPGQITDFVGGTLDGTGVKRTPYGDRYRRTGIQEEGTTVDMSAGMKFTAGPASTGVPAFVQALQSRLRQVCARFGYPEFFTGDASNNNYASSLTAGGPAERAFKRKQHKYGAFQAAVFRRACEYAVEARRLSAADLNAVEIKVKAGGVAIANKLEEAQVQQIRIQNKVLSPQSAMVENGADPKVEMANIKAFDDVFGMGAMGMGGGGFGGDDDGGQLLDATGESYTQFEYELLSEADRSGLVLKTGTDAKGRKYTRWVRSYGDERDAGTKTRQQVNDSRALVAKAVADPNSLTPNELASLAEHLETVNRDDIRGLLKQVGEKTGGAKVELSSRLVERLKLAKELGGVEHLPAVKRRGGGGVGRARKSATGESLAAVVRSYGGIDPNSHAFLTHFSGVSEAREYGMALGVFRNGGRGFDQMAQELASDGHLQIPDGVNPTQYLADQLRNNAASDLYDRKEELEKAEQDYYAAMQAAADEQGVNYGYNPDATAEDLFGHVPGFAEAHRSAENAGDEAAASDPYGIRGSRTQWADAIPF